MWGKVFNLAMARFPPLQNRGHEFLPHRTIEAVNEMKLVKWPEQHLCDTENVSTLKAAAPLFPCHDTGTLTEHPALGDERRSSRGSQVAMASLSCRRWAKLQR